MPQSIPIYTHYASSSNVSPIKRVTATDISIIEEAEPCELHDRVNCSECVSATKSKMDQVLKRSISSNAVNTIKKRRSFVNLHRTLSQTSCYSTGSTSENNINDESFDDFMLLLSGARHQRTDQMWEILPNESKISYLRRLLERQQREEEYGHKISYDDLKTLTSSGRGAVVSQILNKRGGTKRAQRERHNGSKLNDRRSRIIREIAEEIYDEFLQQELEQYERGEDFGQNTHQNREIETPIKDKPDSIKKKSIQYDELQLERDHQQLDIKIKELNELLDKLSSFSPLPTPSTDDGQTIPNNETPVTTITKKSAKPYAKNIAFNQLPKTTTQEKNPGFISCLALKSKSFINIFKHKKKKKPAAQNLYRTPNPS
ncbi:similar to Naumovozyma dairenensis NDAI_0C01930 hypothetical protein [Maudiozyma saulgeensis]|uniref:Uncharacterized protein n=1 Tax=Maudiozyma saulgeensis TaxID=1789683 RepID=A0A1X7QYC5_9SACH|nr:similar to Naumovozyma dairenensis NDAI_0C01930 hypothetical protein [Kazachstania saulgeensis]